MDYEFKAEEQIKCPICGESANYREFPDVVRLVEQLEKYKKYEIISELFVDEQGEAYRQMWEEFKGRARLYGATNQIFLMESIEQKYFPKEAKQDKS